MYPNDKRAFLTTNEELYLKNYGKFKSHSTAVNLFENTYKINRNSKMNLDTVYDKDYIKIDVEHFLKERGPIVTQQDVEMKGKTILSKKIPMLIETQSMIDYKFDPEMMKETIKTARDSFGSDLFKSKLTNTLKPTDDLNYYDTRKMTPSESSNYQPTLGLSHYSHHKNIVILNIFIFDLIFDN